jgi:hypothetical protein
MLILESAFTIVLPVVLGGTALALLPWSDRDIARVDAAAHHFGRQLVEQASRLTRVERLVRARARLLIRN